MRADWYLKAVLTVIAIELGWIALTETATPVTAQAQAAPVVITGFDLRPEAYLPVGVLGQVQSLPASLARSFGPIDTAIRNDAALPVSMPLPVDVRTVSPVTVQADRPLRVENVGFVPAARPGQ